MLKNIKSVSGFLKLAVKYGAYAIVLFDIIKYASSRIDEIKTEYENDNKSEVSEVTQ